MIRRISLLLVAAMLALAPHLAQAQLKVVTSTTDLYDIAKSVGGDKVNATHIGEGYQDPHFIEAKPSFVLQLRNADVWAFVGLDLEIGWMPLLLDGARNPKIRQGGSGYVDASKARVFASYTAAFFGSSSENFALNSRAIRRPFSGSSQ